MARKAKKETEKALSKRVVVTIKSGRVLPMARADNFSRDWNQVKRVSCPFSSVSWVKQLLLLILVLLICASCTDQSGSAQTDATGKGDAVWVVKGDSGKDQLVPPAGYIVQELGGLGGSIVRPIEWHYCCIYAKGTLVFQISKEQCSDGQGFETGMTINVIPGVREKSNVKPTAYAAHFLTKKVEAAEVLAWEEPEEIKHPDMAGKFVRFDILVREEKELRGKKQVFQIGYTVFAHDEGDYIVIMIFGTPASEWDAHYDIYKTMTQDVILIDKDKMEQNLQRGG